MPTKQHSAMKAFEEVGAVKCFFTIYMSMIICLGSK